jgi:hypothetical protein
MNKIKLIKFVLIINSFSFQYVTALFYNSFSLLPSDFKGLPTQNSARDYKQFPSLLGEERIC